MNHIPVITIDGSTGSGKGTLALRLAKKLGWHHLDSGILYRFLALLSIEEHIDFEDETHLAALASDLSTAFEVEEIDGDPHLFLRGNDVTQRIRHEDCSVGSSKVGIYPKVREAMLACQRAFRQPLGLVTDGRDMGTVVFPDADLKLFLQADPKIRAQRRCNQLKKKGINGSLQDIFEDLVARDQRDSGRGVAPLKPASDAVVIDTTVPGVEDVFNQVVELCRQHGFI